MLSSTPWELPIDVWYFIFEWLDHSIVNQFRRLNSWFRERINDAYWERRLPAGEIDFEGLNLSPFERMIFYHSRRGVCRGAERFIHSDLALLRALIRGDSDLIDYFKHHLPFPENGPNRSVMMQFAATVCDEEGELFTELVHCRRWYLISPLHPGIIEPEIIEAALKFLSPHIYARVLPKVFTPPMGICEDIIEAGVRGEVQTICEIVSKVDSTLAINNRLSFCIERSLELALLRLLDHNPEGFRQLLVMSNAICLYASKVVFYAAYQGLNLSRIVPRGMEFEVTEWMARGGHVFDGFNVSVLAGMIFRGDAKAVQVNINSGGRFCSRHLSRLIAMAILRNRSECFRLLLPFIPVGNLIHELTVAIEMGHFKIVLLILEKMKETNFTPRRDILANLLIATTTWGKIDLLPAFLRLFSLDESTLTDAFFFAVKVNGFRAARLLMETMSPERARMNLARAYLFNVNFIHAFECHPSSELRLVRAWESMACDGLPIFPR